MSAFNLRKIKVAFSENPTQILQNELGALWINKVPGGYMCSVGDENIFIKTLLECKELISEGIDELREHAWESWKELARTAEWITTSRSENKQSKDNILFLNYLKKSFLLSLNFDDLDFIEGSIRPVLDLDISEIDTGLIKQFNSAYLRIRSLHRLIMSDIYRIKVIDKYLELSGRKYCQVSGPWSNLDLPMKERVWPFDDMEEEYFETRKQERRNQTRYNPEYDQIGFYYNWQEWNRAPYKFEDMKEDSPYKSRRILTIP